MKDFYTLNNIKKIQWGVLEENNPISLSPIMYPGWSHIIERVGKILGKSQKSIICLHQGKSGLIFVDHKEWNDLGIFVLRKILKNPSFAEKLNKDILKFSDSLASFMTKNIFLADLKNKTDKELINLYRQYEKRHGDLYTRAIIPVYLELYKPNLTKYLVDYLEKQVKRYKYQRTSRECFSILTAVEDSSKVQLEEKSLLKIALEINKNKKARILFESKGIKIILKGLVDLDKNLSNKIKAHMDHYRYLGYNFEGPAFPDSYFIKRLAELVKKKEDINKILKKFDIEKKNSRKLIEAVNKDLRLDKKHLRLFQIARGIIYGKDYRKMSLVESYYKVEPLLREIGRRSQLSLDEVRNCVLALDEIKAVLNGRKPVDLAQRMKGCLFVVADSNLSGRVFTNDIYLKMHEYLKKKEDYSQISYFHGQTASLGQARGIVKIINTIKDLGKMKEGDILVSQMTNPDLVPAMKKAAAIITDLGGITCHAAIVSRELKKPCIIGTRMATQALKDGDRVFVDANTGEIRKIK